MSVVNILHSVVNILLVVANILLVVANIILGVVNILLVVANILLGVVNISLVVANISLGVFNIILGIVNILLVVVNILLKSLVYLLFSKLKSFNYHLNSLSMSYQNISESVSDENFKAIKQAINVIAEKLPFLITLSTDEKRSLTKLGPKSLDFVRECIVVTENYPEILPTGLDTKELAKDSKLFEQLSELKMLLNSLNEKVNDTTIAVGNEAMKASLSVYDYVKAAAKTIAGLKSVAQSLFERFKRAKKTKE